MIGRLKAIVPWDDLTATTTTRTFKRIKEHVLELKESFGDQDPILQPGELRRQLKDSDPEWDFTDDEMMTAVGHLVTHGYITRFQRTNGDEIILLAPDLLAAEAADAIHHGSRPERSS